MKISRILSCTSIILACLHFPAQAAERIYLLAGQSNMMGKAKTHDLPPAYKATPNNVTFYYQGRARKLAQYALFGPEVSFAHEIARAFPQDTHILIKQAATGSNIAQWQPDQALYKGLLRQLRFSLEQEHPRIDAVIWMQGESDARSPALAAQYTPRLTRLIQSVRTDLKSPNSLFIMGEVNPEGGAFTWVRQVQNSQRQVQRTLPNTLIISTQGLEKMDNVHYDARGQMELGKRFAQSYIQHVNKRAH